MPLSPTTPSRTPRIRALGLLASAVLAAVAAACGGGAREDSAYGGKSADPLSSAEADLEQAEARLARAFGGPPAKKREERPEPPGADTPPQPGPMPPPPADSTAVQESAGGASEEGEPGGCETACDALAAMRKAAGRVCDIAPGERCDAARARVASAEKRVLEACPECEA